jgi:tRNA A37 threonylcarbamoyltransferase TsaD
LKRWPNGWHICFEALHRTGGKVLAVAVGVSANRQIREALEKKAGEKA